MVAGRLDPHGPVARPSRRAPAGPAPRAGGAETAGSVLEVAAEVLGQVRRAKTTAKRSMRCAGGPLEVADTAERLAALLPAEDDLRDAGGVATLITTEADQPVVDVELSDQE